MVEKSLAEEHKEEYGKYLMEEHEKGKEALQTEDEKLEEKLLAEGIEEEEEALDEEETEDEKLEKEILAEGDLEEILGADTLIEEKIKEKRINNFLMNQEYDASLSDTGIEPIMNLEEELEEIPLEQKEDEADFSYKTFEEEEDKYKTVVERYESGKRSPEAPPELRITPEQRLEQQSKMYKSDSASTEDPDNKFLEFKQPKETGYDNNISSKARRGIY